MKKLLALVTIFILSTGCRKHSEDPKRANAPTFSTIVKNFTGVVLSSTTTHVDISPYSTTNDSIEVWRPVGWSNTQLPSCGAGAAICYALSHTVDVTNNSSAPMSYTVIVTHLE